MKRKFSYLLKQHIGSPSKPIVQKGDKVLRGQLIAEAPKDQLGANVFSSISGEVEEVTEQQIRIIADEIQSKEYVKLTSDAPLDLIRESGLVGLGGAGFPTYAKLQKPFTGEGTVIVNAAECEPILDHNMRRIDTEADKLIKGLKIVMEAVKANKGIIAIKNIHTEEIERLKTGINESNIAVATLPNMYPMGEERAIVREVLGTLLEVDQLPMAANAIVINAETVFKIREAVEDKKPLIEKDMTVAGKLQGKLLQVMLDMPLGMLIGDVFKEAGGIGLEYGEIVMGGPFTGKRVSLEDPIIKTTGGLIATEEFWKGPEKIGLLVCACGGNKERLEQIAASMGSKVVGIEYCKQAKELKNGTRKCENPGKCPGQVQKVLKLKKDGAQALLISNCTDCSNTVMSCAPQLKLPVYHCTDGPLRAVNMKLVRRIKE
ncbi:proline reductase-associated electron transfer protein PrdC [Anaerotignum sp.]|uniref:proline reductase-associated electron transfer protein PrdC n=1 Tax=Anaerotignum sp. TaxID=2039241 RepID=UPI0027149F73|nr:proline reductase-associated electron transfer protein PrdC [Anaerotignum sp.]